MGLTTAQKENLIIEVQKYEYLYNPKHKCAFDAEMRDNAWKAIAAKLDITFKQAKSGWNNIRDAYKSNKRKNKSRSGQASTKRRPYIFARELQFLEAHIEQDERDDIVSNIPGALQGEMTQNSPDNDLNSDDDDAVQPHSDEDVGLSVEPSAEPSVERTPMGSTSRPLTPATPASNLFKAKGRRKSKDVVGERIMDYLQGRAKEPCDIPAPPAEESDADKLFLLSLLPDIKELTSRNKGKLKIKLMQAVQEAIEDQEAQAQRPSRASSSASLFSPVQMTHPLSGANSYTECSYTGSSTSNFSNNTFQGAERDGGQPTYVTLTDALLQ